MRPDNVEATAQGAAFLAGLACGIWKQEELPSLLGGHRAFVPQMDDTTRARLTAEWQDAVRRTRTQ